MIFDIIAITLVVGIFLYCRTTDWYECEIKHKDDSLVYSYKTKKWQWITKQ